MDGGSASHLPVDKGWAWMTVLGCFVMHIFVVGSFKSLGILFVEILTTFETSNALTAWIPAVLGGLMCLLSPLTNGLTARFGGRPVVMVGGFLFATGFSLCFFAESMEYVLGTFAIISGVGFSMSYAPSVTVVGHWFDKRRALANGLSVAGGSVGQFIIPPLSRFLIDNYTYRGAFLILGGLCFHVVFCGALYRPFNMYRKSPVQQKADFVTGRDESDADGGKEIKISGEKNLHLRNKRLDEVKHQDNFLGPVRNSVDVQRDPTLQSDSALNARPRVQSDAGHLLRKAALSGVGYKPATEGDKPGVILHHQSDPEINQSEQIKQKQSLNHRGIWDHLISPEINVFPSSSFLFIPSVQNIPRATEEWPSDEQSALGSHRTLGGSTFASLQEGVATKTKKIPLFDFTLFKNALFIVLFFTNVLGQLGYFNQFIFIPALAKSLGIDDTRGALLLSIVGGADLVGRVSIGLFTDYHFLKTHHIMLITLMITGISSFGVSFVTGYTGLVVYCVCLGLFGGAFIAVIAVTLVEVLGLERLAYSMGLLLLGTTISTVGSPPFLGWVADTTGSYSWLFRICGISMVTASTILCLEPVARKYEVKKEQLAAGTSDLVQTDQTCTQKLNGNLVET